MARRDLLDPNNENRQQPRRPPLGVPSHGADGVVDGDRDECGQQDADRVRQRDRRQGEGANGGVDLEHEL